MTEREELRASVAGGGCDRLLQQLYGEQGVRAARQRIEQVLEQFAVAFPQRTEAVLFSAPGRTEMGGNHTDHQHGHVLCAGVDLDILACASPGDPETIRLRSEGYPEVVVDLGDLTVHDEERGTSAALVRGVCAGIAARGHAVRGFDGYAMSTVPAGAGLSSSAAYEVLVGQIINHFSCADALDAVTIAQIGQYAENVYFGKPSGLMDQMGSAVGAAAAIDFKDPEHPVVEKICCNLEQAGYTLCIVDTGSSHADLTEDYAAITREMGAVAACFGCRFLREVPEEEFHAAIPALRRACGDRAILRAMHYYGDDRRAAAEAAALRSGAYEDFFRLVNESGLSSALLLQNTCPASNPRQQAIPLCLALGRELLAGRGAIRVHGGGFAGTIQAYVPLEQQVSFRTGMETVTGPGSCYFLHIRPVGGGRILG